MSDPGPKLLAVCDAGGAVQAWSGAAARMLHDAGEGRWPTWSRGGRMLAWSWLGIVEGALRSRVLISNTWPGSTGLPAYTVPDGVPPVIAPNVPHYVHWSPEGSRLAVVARTESALGLWVVAVDEPGAPTLLAEGAPVFATWAPSGDKIAAHVGRDLFLIDAANGSREQLTTEAVGFRVPAWSSDGSQLAFALPADGGVSVVTTGADGWGRSVVAQFPGGVALCYVGGGKTLAAGVASRPDSGMFDGLWLVRPSDAPVRIARGPFAAFHWSPDGTRVALLVPAQSGDGLWLMRVLDCDGRAVAETDRFLPSADMQTQTAFFDQYVLSHPIWAADGSSLVLAIQRRGDRVPGAFGDPLGDEVCLWRPEPRSPFEPLTHGGFAAFAPGWPPRA